MEAAYPSIDAQLQLDLALDLGPLTVGLRGEPKRTFISRQEVRGCAWLRDVHWTGRADD